jgi:acetyl-CoA/propionyl-CoA carboxylase biotin carboxyl carrier protein
LAKLIVTGSSREDALERSRRALDEFEIAGLPTVLPFHRKIVRDPAFTDSPFRIYTRWIETDFDNDIEPWSGELHDGTAAAVRHNVVVEVDGKRVEVSLPTKLVASAGGALALSAPPKRRASSSVNTVTGDTMKAPMQATVVKLAVVDGDRVVKGDLILVLEAMKMEQPLVAHKDGTVAGLNATVGMTVSSGHVLLSISE